MIYTKWEQVTGKEIEKVEQYSKEFSWQYKQEPPSPYAIKYWDVIFFNDGVLIQEYTDVHHESGSLFFINEINTHEPPTPEIMDIINKYK